MSNKIIPQLTRRDLSISTHPDGGIFVKHTNNEVIITLSDHAKLPSFFSSTAKPVIYEENY